MPGLKLIHVSKSLVIIGLMKSALATIASTRWGCNINADGIFIQTFLLKHFCIFIKIPPKFVPDGPIDKSQHLV